MSTVWDLLPAMSVFAFVTAMTPGPNNFLLASSGAQFGIRHSLRHLVGIRIGVIGLVLLCAGGVALALKQHPELYRVLQFLGLGYMLWLVVKLMCFNAIGKSGSAGKPLSMKQAMLFQLGNVKAWMGSLALVTSYSLPSHYWLSVFNIVVVFTVFGLFANTCWAGVGRWINQYLNTSLKQRAFNVSLGCMTLLSLLPAITEMIKL